MANSSGLSMRFDSSLSFLFDLHSCDEMFSRVAT